MKEKNKLKKAKKIFSVVNRKLKQLYPHIKIALNYRNAWELLVATILSAQTTDKKVNEVTDKLFKKYKTLDDYLKVDLNEFQEDIKAVNYYKNKAKFILENAKLIKTKYGGQLPKTIDEMLKLKGVARKTANIVLANAYGILQGIAVDTHVKRLSRLLGLTDQTDPVKIEQDLMQVIPQKEWRDFPLRLIQYGRDYCPAKKHNHNECPLTKALTKARLI